MSASIEIAQTYSSNMVMRKANTSLGGKANIKCVQNNIHVLTMFAKTMRQTCYTRITATCVQYAQVGSKKKQVKF